MARKLLTRFFVLVLLFNTVMLVSNCGGEEGPTTEGTQTQPSTEEQPSAPVVGGGLITAKQAYALAQPAAKDKMSDAQPISISGRPERDALDGRSERWLVNFGKPGTTTNTFRVIIEGGKLEGTGSFPFITKPRPEQFSGTWIDSTEAVEVAQKKWRQDCGRCLC